MQPACSLTHSKFFSSGDGGEVDLDVTRANFCSSSRTAENVVAAEH